MYNRHTYIIHIYKVKGEQILDDRICLYYYILDYDFADFKEVAVTTQYRESVTCYNSVYYYTL